jgi:hypothetical protein
MFPKRCEASAELTMRSSMANRSARLVLTGVRRAPATASSRSLCSCRRARCCRVLAETRQRPRRATASDCAKLRRARESPLLERIPLHAHARISDPKPRRNQNAKRDSSKALKRRFSQLRFQIRVCIRACIRAALPWVSGAADDRHACVCVSEVERTSCVSDGRLAGRLCDRDRARGTHRSQVNP